MSDYLFTVPQSFDMAYLSLALAILGSLVSIGAMLYYKKRHEQVKLQVSQRRLIRQHAQINLGLMLGYLLYVIVRMLHVDFLSYRIIGFVVLFAALINVILAAVKVIHQRGAGAISENTTSDNVYSKYLPKKKKK